MPEPKKPFVISIDFKELLPDLLAAPGPISEYLLFLCPYNLDPVKFDAQRKPHESYSPMMCALHGWVYSRGSLQCPCPPHFTGDRSRLFDWEAGKPIENLAVGDLPFRSWLDHELPAWKGIVAEMGTYDPLERQGLCRIRVREIANPLYIKFANMEFDEESYTSREEAIVDSLIHMIVRCYNLPGIEAGWSDAYKAYRSEDLKRMKAALSKPNSRQDSHYLFEGILSVLYRDFVSRPPESNRSITDEFKSWAICFLKNLRQFYEVIPRSDEGKMVSSALQHVVMYYERVDELEASIHACDTGIELGLWDTTKGGFVARRERLLAKRETQSR